MKRVLIVYYSYTGQATRVAEAMAETFRQRGWEVDFGRIEFTDPRYDMNFPLRPFWRKMLRMIPPQVLGRCGEFRLDAALLDQHYDLVCIGSPTWWLNPAMPIVSFLKSAGAPKLLSGRPFAVFTVSRALWRLNLRKVRRLAKKSGGVFAGSEKFRFPGGQVRSMLSFINYLKNGEDRPRFWGWNIFPFGVADEGIEAARCFAQRLVEGLPEEGEASLAGSEQESARQASC